MVQMKGHQNALGVTLVMMGEEEMMIHTTIRESFSLSCD